MFVRLWAVMSDPNTLQGMLESGTTIHAFCVPTHYCHCHHGSVLDTRALIDRLGQDFAVYRHHARFLGMLRCTKCGRRHAEIRLSVGNTGPGLPVRSAW